MTAKEYLSQVGKIQTRIKCLTEQVQFMREAAENVTSVISDMPRSPNRNISRLENSVIRIVDLEEKLQAELNRLVEINFTISRLADPTEQGIVIKRYLNHQRWDEIASDLDVSNRRALQIHQSALDHVDAFLLVAVSS
jgi:DNA-directed RNA polymerase specialized sigma subunit